MGASVSHSLPVGENVEESDGPPECLICRNLRFMPSTSTGDTEQLEREMNELNVTEATSVIPGTQPMWPAESKPHYPTILEYKRSAREGCRCCAFVVILYNLGIQLIIQYGFTTVNGWGMGCTDSDIHALVYRPRGNMRLRLTNAKWPMRAWRDLDWDVYTLADQPTPIPYARGVAPIPQMIIHSADTVRKWLKTCQENHTNCCVKDKSFSPKRLVRISGQDLSNTLCNPLSEFRFPDDPTLKLIEPTEPVPYAALSYCWGTAHSQWVTTTRATLAERMRDIPFSTLPRTLHDVIMFARLLGLEHIWIDALCIIQDDAEDWTAEAARMGDVYGAAELVLAANVTGDCTRPTVGHQIFGMAYQICLPMGGGFDQLLPGRAWNRRSMAAEFPMPGEFSDKDMIVLRMAHLHLRVQGATAYRPLDMRAWTTQESLLGRRMLSFTNFECVWTCDETVACECEHSQEALKMQQEGVSKTEPMSQTGAWYRPVQRVRRAAVLGELPDDLPSTEMIFITWRQLVSDYTQRQVTVEGDKLVAISGLARIFGRVLQMIAEKERGKEQAGRVGHYLAGLWTDNLHHDLLWLVQRYPQQMALSIDFGDADAQLDAQFPNQQRDIADEPNAAFSARNKWFRTRPARPSAYRAPSWSWASSNFCIVWLLDIAKSEIEMSGGGEHTTAMTPYLTLVEHHVDALPDEYGAIAAAYMTVRAPLIQVRSRVVPPPPESTEQVAAINRLFSPLLDAATRQSLDVVKMVASQTADQVRYGFVRTESGLVFEYFPDEEIETTPISDPSVYDCLFGGWEKPCGKQGCGCGKGWSEDTVWCLRVCQTVIAEKEGLSRFQEGWLLLKWSAGDDAYVRLGVGKFAYDGPERDFGLFADAKETVVRII
jgi:hypothetical protein